MTSDSPEDLFRAEKERSLSERGSTHAQLLAEAKAAFDKLMAEGQAARKSGRPRKNPLPPLKAAVPVTLATPVNKPAAKPARKSAAKPKSKTASKKSAAKSPAKKSGAKPNKKRPARKAAPKSAKKSAVSKHPAKKAPARKPAKHGKRR